MSTAFNLAARWILIDAPPGVASDECTARLGFESTSGGPQVLGDVVITPCRDLADALEQSLGVIAALGISMNPVFSLLYPRYEAQGRLEVEMHQIAWAIKDEADKRGWHFAREMPLAIRHLPGE